MSRWWRLRRCRHRCTPPWSWLPSHLIPQIEVDAPFLVQIGETNYLDEAGFEGVVDWEVGDEPLEQGSLRFGRAGAVPGCGREVDDQRDSRRLGDPLEDLAPLDVAGVLALPGALLSVDVVRFVVDDHEIAPATEHPANYGIRVLLRPPPHGAEHGSR